LTQVGEDFVVSMASAKKLNWVGIWKSVKKIDKDSNGYVTLEELDEIFREWFPIELDKKTLNRYFRSKYGSIQNRNLINYKQLKLDIQGKLPNLETTNSSQLQFSESKLTSIHNRSTLDESVFAKSPGLRIDGT